MSDGYNANPTIRNVSDLPSRQGRPSNEVAPKASLVFLTSTIPPSAYTPDPFEPSSDSGNSDEDDAVEPIDEQEIYGIASHHLGDRFLKIGLICRMLPR